MKFIYKLNLLFCLSFSLNSCNAKQFISRQEINSLKILKTFAESYSPKNKINESPDMLPKVSQEIKTAIYEAGPLGEKYLTLILLKLYVAHLKCCNQSYELRPDTELDSISNPILDEFIKITRLYDLKKPIEFIPSSIAYDWVSKHSDLNKYSAINKEMKKFKKNN